MKKYILTLNIFLIIMACFLLQSQQDITEEVLLPQTTVYEQQEYNTQEATVNTTSNEDTYLKSYFNGLTSNMGMNSAGSCGFVAMGMLLSYYDSFLDDSIIPEQYDVVSFGEGSDMVARKNSPGVLNDDTGFDIDETIMQNMNENEKKVYLYGKYMEYLDEMYNLEDTSLHAKLITIGRIKGILDFDNILNYSPYAITTSKMQIVLKNYLDNVANIQEYEIKRKNTKNDLASEIVRNYVISKVKDGYPVLVWAKNTKLKKSHAFICYDYDFETDTLYGNMGWAWENKTHFNFESRYPEFVDAIILDFPNKEHVHSYNYEVEHGDHVDKYCYCNNNIRTYKSSIDGFDKMPCFNGTVTIPSWATSISDGVFKDQSEITDIVIESGSKLESIGAHAFDNAGYAVLNISYDPSGYDLVIPSSVTTIGDYAFNDFALLSIEFGANSLLKTIGNYAFSECGYLKDIVIPKNVEYLGDYAFKNCKKLNNVEFECGSKLKEIGSHAFYFTSMSHFEVPKGVTKLGEYVFYGNSSISSITIPSSVEYMGKHAACYSYFGPVQRKVTVYTECLSKKSGWDNAWNGTNPNPVFWGCTLDDNSCVEKIATDVVRLTDRSSSSDIKQPYKKGYFFVGWNSNPNSSGAAYTIKTIINGVAGPLYSIWSTTPGFGF